MLATSHSPKPPWCVSFVHHCDSQVPKCLKRGMCGSLGRKAWILFSWYNPNGVYGSLKYLYASKFEAWLLFLWHKALARLKICISMSRKYSRSIESYKPFVVWIRAGSSFKNLKIFLRVESYDLFSFLEIELLIILFDISGYHSKNWKIIVWKFKGDGF
jgi:hypothetical protein